MDLRELSSGATGEKCDTIRQRVVAARQIQLQRFRKSRRTSNAAMSPRQVKTHCKLDSEAADTSNTRWRK